MRMMFRFEKGEAVRFISHLDLLRAMQRALSRSGLPLIWSQGFHPHPVFSFAMALPVGASSQSEYMEVALETMEPALAAQALGAVMGPGLSVLGAAALPDDAPSLMAAVAAADWRLPVPPGEDAQSASALLSREQILVEKHGKNGPRIADIRPGILSLSMEDGALLARLAAGSQNNVSPAHLIPALWPQADALTVPVHRIETYCLKDNNLMPLLSLA